MRHSPALPPAHPAFRPLIASVPELVERVGPRATATLLRERADTIADACDPDRVFRAGVNAFDLAELLNWLLARADELEAT